MSVKFKTDTGVVSVADGFGNEVNSASQLAPIITRLTGTDLALPTGSVNSWVDAQTTGTIAARDMDLVIPNVRAGQLVGVHATFSSVSAAGAGYLDMAPIVNGVAQRRFGAGDNSTDNSTWALPASSAVFNSGGLRTRRLTAGDIENGNVRLRLRWRQGNTSGQRSLLGTYGFELALQAQGPWNLRPGPIVLFDGQSLNHSSPPDTMPKLVGSALGLPWLTPATSGRSWTQLASTAAARVFPLSLAYDRSIAVLTGGTSDLIAAASGGDDDSATTAFNDLVNYANALKAYGYVDHIIVSTVTKSHYLDADGETQRQALNDLIRGGSAAYDAVADLAASPLLTDNTNTTYYYDGTHWAEAGNQAAADIIRPLVESVV